MSVLFGFLPQSGAELTERALFFCFCFFYLFFQVLSPSCSFLISTLRLEEMKNEWASLGAPMVKNLPAMQETWVQTLRQEDPLQRGMATHSSILA